MKFSTSPISKLILFTWLALSLSLISPPAASRAQGKNKLRYSRADEEAATFGAGLPRAA